MHVGKSDRIKILKLLVIFLFAWLILGPLAHKVSAHFPATDNDITVVLHVDPEDDPAAGQPTTLGFIFSDITNRFKLADCVCVLSITERGQELYYSALTPPKNPKLSIYGDTLAFTFPRRDTYYIALSGLPDTPGNFQPFNLHWNFRVDQAAVKSSGPSFGSFVHYFIAVFGILIAVGGAVFFLDHRAED